MGIIIAILVLYMGGMLAIGFMGKKSSESMNEFLTAGKSGGMFVMVCTYIGAHVGNGIVVGGAQYGAEHGIGGIWFGLGACLSYILFATVMSRMLYRNGYLTIPDLIRDRYQSKFASVLMAVLNICATLGIMAAQIMAGAVVRLEDGGTEHLAADTVIAATGFAPLDEEAEQLRGCAYDFWKIGDCFKVRKIFNAMREGYNAGAHI